MRQKLKPVLTHICFIDIFCCIFFNNYIKLSTKIKNPKLQLVEAKLKFFVKQLQSENEALFEQI